MPKQATDIRDDAAYFWVTDLAGDSASLCLLGIKAHPEERQDLPTEDVMRLIMTWEQMEELGNAITQSVTRKRMGFPQ